MTRRTLLQLVTSGLLMLAKTGFAQDGLSPGPVPRSQCSPLAAARAQGHVPQEPDTWYEFLRKQFNRPIEGTAWEQSPSGNATENDELKAKLQQTAANLRAMTSERDGLKDLAPAQENLRRPRRDVVSHLPM